MQLIINADDYGKDIRTTQAIADAFSRGFCSSTTIMANGDAYEEALEIAAANHFCGRIGIHLNLTEGKSLTEPISRLEHFCDTAGYFNACFHHSCPVKMRGLSQKEKEAVNIEIRAQVEKCLKSGLTLSHVDSHHHIHTRWEIWQVIEPVLRDYNLRRVRISRNCGSSISLPKLVYKFIYNKHLKTAGFKTTDYFGSAADVAGLFSGKPQLKNKEISVEVMVHPNYLTSNELLDLDGLRLEDIIKALPGWASALAYS